MDEERVLARRDNGKGPVPLGPSPHDRFVLAIKPYQLKLETCVGGVRAQLFQQCGENVKLIASQVIAESAIPLMNSIVIALNATTEALHEARGWVFDIVKRSPAAASPSLTSPAPRQPQPQRSNHLAQLSGQSR